MDKKIKAKAPRIYLLLENMRAKYQYTYPKNVLLKPKGNRSAIALHSTTLPF